MSYLQMKVLLGWRVMHVLSLMVGASPLKRSSKAPIKNSCMGLNITPGSHQNSFIYHHHKRWLLYRRGSRTTHRAIYPVQISWWSSIYAGQPPQATKPKSIIEHWFSTGGLLPKALTWIQLPKEYWYFGTQGWPETSAIATYTTSKKNHSKSDRERRTSFRLMKNFAANL